MKKRNIISVAMILIGSLLTLVNTVSATKIGANYSAWGIELGWIMIGAGVLFAVLFGFGVLAIGKKGAGNKGAYSVLAVVIMVGLAFPALD